MDLPCYTWWPEDDPKPPKPAEGDERLLRWVREQIDRILEHVDSAETVLEMAGSSHCARPERASHLGDARSVRRASGGM